jgi:drug/metabolite transporter (DMT)-like permease
LSVTVFVIVLLAAALHAAWNALVKGASDKLLTTILVAASASVMAAATLPFLQQPAATSWPFILGSAVLQVIYFILVARTYQLADMSQTYPLMRGIAPLLVAISSTLVLGAALTSTMWLGIAVICCGILSMAAGIRRGDGKGIALAILNAVVIAGYTLIDGIGVRRSGAAAGYTLWIFLIAGIPLAAWAAVARRTPMTRYIRQNPHLGLVGGLGTVAAYGLALWAMTVAPIAVVAALRETSIVYGTIISALILKERIGAARLTAVCAIALGAAVLRLA